MRKLLPLLALVLAVLACDQPLFQPAATPTPSITPSPTLPPPTATYTPTPLPTPTPTPIPAQRVQSGDHALFNGDWDAALAAYQDALIASSDAEIKAAALLGQGRIYYESGYYPGALDALRAVIDDFSDSPHRAEAYFYLGETYMALTRYVEAADAYLNYWMLRPGVIDAYIAERRGDALFAAGQYSEAQRDYESAISSPRLSTDFALEIKLAHTYAGLGDYATALVMYNDIFNRTGNDYIKAEADYLSGQIYALLGQYDQAYAVYVDAVDNYPLAYYSYLGLVELVNAGYPVDELQRGIVDYNVGEYGVALAAFDRYLAAAPADPAAALYYKGLILRSQMDYEEAVAAWDAIIQGYPSHYFWDDAWEQKGYTQWAYMDQYTAGQETLLGFVTAAPAHARAAEFLFDAAGVAERDGRLEDAAWLWERIPGEYPDSDYVYRALMMAGLAHYRLADYAGAQAVFWRAQSLATTQFDRTGALFWIGKTYAAQGDDATALATWQQTAAMDPTGYYSERSRDLILSRPPFAPPKMFDLGMDREVEIAQAEEWMRQTFALPANADLTVPGTLADDARFQRGQELWRLGLYAEAATEFDALRQEVALDPVSTYRLALFCSDLGLYRQSILAARQVLNLAGMDDAESLTAPSLFSHIRFGTYFSDLVFPAAQEYGFHPLFVWSLMRQESLFEPFITSGADARGLMQIVPATGQDVANRMDWPPNYTADDLTRPLVSVDLGLYYLASLRDAFDGDMLAAMAAYNGGPGNASTWKDLAAGDPDMFVEMIRFDETRRYVMGIYEVYDIYRQLYERNP
jgi:soluble lytic murein transglycosylase